ncbi:MAG: hypothetical protein WCK55_04805 [Verrucomicrobiota bacterium]
MSLALYMDGHVPAAITCGLRRRSVEVLTAQEDGTAKLDDLANADQNGAISDTLRVRSSR